MGMAEPGDSNTMYPFGNNVAPANAPLSGYLLDSIDEEAYMRKQIQSAMHLWNVKSYKANQRREKRTSERKRRKANRR